MSRLLLIVAATATHTVLRRSHRTAEDSICRAFRSRHFSPPLPPQPLLVSRRARCTHPTATAASSHSALSVLMAVDHQQQLQERQLKPEEAAALTQLLASKPRIILGSSSSSRRAILDELAAVHGFTYEIAKADIDEKAIRAADPQRLVLVLAHAKAEAIRAKLRAGGHEADRGLLLTCDQVVVHEGRILEKPESEAEAREFIAGYARAPASTVGSVVVTDLASGASWEGVDIAEIHFGPIPQDSVDQLIEEGEVFWCAGGLTVEHELVQPHVTKMLGTEDSVMGLSKALVLKLLAQAALAGSS